MQHFTDGYRKVTIINVKVATMFEPNRSIAHQMAVEHQVFSYLRDPIVPYLDKQRVLTSLRTAFLKFHKPYFTTEGELSAALDKYLNNQMDIAEEIAALSQHYHDKLTSCYLNQDIHASFRLVFNAKVFLHENKYRLSLRKARALREAIKTASG